MLPASSAHHRSGVHHARVMACTLRLVGTVLAIVLGELSLAGAADRMENVAIEPVRPKATLDRPDFAIRSLVLRDGAILAYYVRAGTGPTLVLVPETNGDRTQFYTEEFLGGLDRDWQIVIIETRGQGRSWPAPTPEQASIEHYARDVLEVVEEMGLKAWYIGGHSLGGMIALEIAGLKPVGLRGVISLEGWVHSRVPEQAFPNQPQWSEAQRIEARRQREARYLSHRWTAAEYASLTSMWRKWERGEAIVKSCELPILAVFGDRGMSQRPDRSLLLLPDKPTIEVSWIVGSGHYVTSTRFAAVTAAAIARFVRRVEIANAPRVVGSQIVYREAGRFGGWPANHGAWAWGDEFLVGFESAWHQTQDVTRHQIDRTRSPESCFARSRDGGETWTIERPGVPPPVDVAVKQRSVLKEPLNFTHPDFAFTLRFHASGPAFFYYSYDRGRTWHGPFDFPDLGTPGILARTDYEVIGPRSMIAFLSARKRDGREGRPLCARTDDGGLTWRLVSYIGPEPEGFSIMPSTVRLDSGDLLTTVRVKQDDKRSSIEAWISHDEGATWNLVNRPAPATGAYSGNPPDLLRLSDGRLCLVYGYRTEPRGIRARLSSDQGRTWSNEFVLRADAVTHDLGYTRSFQRSDGRIVTVYYYNDGPHSERFIAATTWDPGR
ncbi:MAG: alpha/beta fold hydrolase [Opitutaceae bacterium]|nr:alpha/beta fold hydrolase [Opitutaceae bacterium]